MGSVTAHSAGQLTVGYLVDRLVLSWLADLSDGAVVTEVTSLLALPCALPRPRTADLTERTVAVRPAETNVSGPSEKLWARSDFLRFGLFPLPSHPPAAGPTDVLLAELAGQAVGVVEADLDADPGVGARGGLGLGDAALAQRAVRVGAAALQTHVPHAAVAGPAAAAAVARAAAYGGPHAAVLGVRGAVTGDSWGNMGP